MMTTQIALKGLETAMAAIREFNRPLALTLSATALMTIIGASGCAVDVGGQTLPSPYYQQDDVQYFPAGPEFKLSREAAAMKAARAQERARIGGPTPVSVAPVPGVIPAPAAAAAGEAGEGAQLPGPGIAPAPGEMGIQAPDGAIPAPDGGPEGERPLAPGIP